MINPNYSYFDIGDIRRVSLERSSNSIPQSKQLFFLVMVNNRGMIETSAKTPVQLGESIKRLLAIDISDNEISAAGHCSIVRKSVQ